MSKIDNIDIQNRLSMLRRMNRHSRQWYGDAISDRQLLKRRVTGFTTLILLAIFWLLFWGLKSWFESGTLSIPTRIYTIFILVFIGFGTITIYRTRKLLSVFNAFSAQNFEDLELAIGKKASDQASTGPSAISIESEDRDKAKCSYGENKCNNSPNHNCNESPGE